MQRLTRRLCQSLLIVLALLVPCASLPAQEKPFDLREVERWLARSGVKLLAVDFYAQGCEPCKRDLPKWQALHEKYAKRGFRFVLVKVQEEGACITLPEGFKPDDQRCDFDSQTAAAWNVNSFPKSFLWNWRGEKLVDHGDFGSVKVAVETYFAKEPRILVDGEGPEGARLCDEVRAELTETSKFEVLASEKEQVELKRLRAKVANNPNYDENHECTLGVAMPPNSRLSVSRRGDRLGFTLYNLESGCVSRQLFTNVGDNLHMAVKEGVDGLIQALAGEAQSPSGGSVPRSPASSATITGSDVGSLMKRAEQLEAEKKHVETELAKHNAEIEASFEKVRDVAIKDVLAKEERLRTIRAFLKKYPISNPRKAEAEQLIKDIEEGRSFAQPSEVKDEANGVTWVSIPAGRFMMGCSPNDSQCDDDEKPRVKVSVKHFLIMKQKVTQDLYRSVMGETPSHFANCGASCPVESVDWEHAKAFCAKIGGRLPKEAEWEYAARAGTENETYVGPLSERQEGYGRELNAIAWYSGNSQVRYGGEDCSGRRDKYRTGGELCGPHPVAEKDANPWGLVDALGNVWEWVDDCYRLNYGAAKDCSARVLRGGAWNSTARNVRVSNRDRMTPTRPTDYIGFRCAKD